MYYHDFKEIGYRILTELCDDIDDNWCSCTN